MITDDPNNRIPPMKHSNINSPSEPTNTPDPVEPWRFQRHARPQMSWALAIGLAAGFALALVFGWALS